MPHDPIRVADTRAWLAKAASDLRMSRVAANEIPPLLDQAVYHAQQAAEKALKCFLAWHDRPFRKTHDLAELGRLCVQIDAGLADVCRRAESLTAYAWTFRYPGDAAEPTAAETKAAIELTDEVMKAMLARLPPELAG